MILFKKRNFSEMLSDSFTFFKQDGKHFFKNYFILNGVFLMLLIALSYFLFQVYFESLTSGTTLQGDQNPLLAETLFSDNAATIAVGAIIFIILMLFITLINFAYPVIYLKLYEKNNGPNFQIREMITELRSKIGKLLRFYLLSLVTIFPVVALVLGVLVLLSIFIIGIPLLMITIPVLFSLMGLTLYEYLNSDAGFFASILKALDYIFKQFWTILGSTIIIYMLIQVILTIISLIPYIIGMISIFSIEEENTPDTNALSALGILMTVVFAVSILANYILHNLLMINQGMIYYSSREIIEKKSSLNEIDSIGNNFE